MYEITDPVIMAQIKADYFENHGPLSKTFSSCSWTSGMTSPIDIIDRAAFRNFLKDQGVSYQELNDLFLLYRANFQRWPGSDTASIEFKDEFVVRTQEADGVDSDPFAFWRAVSCFMVPDTFFRVIEIGYVGYAPWVVGRETNYLAMAITVTANGDVIIQDFENYFVQPFS